MSLRTVVVAGLSLLLGFASRGAAEDAGPDLEQALVEIEADPLAAAPVDTWSMQDGCPARTRATLTPPLLGATEVAWTFEAPGSIEGDPRVWKDWVVVASKGGAGCYLDVLRLTNGKPLGSRRAYKANTHLDPVVWNHLIFVNDAGGTSEALRIVPEMNMLTTAWKTSGE